MRKGSGRRGFTIVELVVVIVVIAILSAVMIPTFANVIRHAREATDKQTIKVLNKMLAVGELEAEDIKRYKLRNEEWEIAYSYNSNETVIVDKSGKIMAASKEESVGTDMGEEYVLASEIGKASGGNNKPDENNESDNPNEGDWRNATRVESDLSNLSEQIKGKKELYICDNVASIPQSCFFGNENLERVYIGEGIKEISASAFEGCAKLREVYMAGEGIEIGADAFYGCSALEKINLCKVRRIGQRAFVNCSKLTDIELKSLISMDTYAFKGSGVKEMELPESLQTMYNNTFAYCELKKLTIKSGVEVQETSGNGVDFTVKELVIGGEEGIAVSESLWIYISNVIVQSKETLIKVTVKNISVGESLLNIKPFLKLSKDAQIIIADKESYISILGGRSESAVFGCNESNIIKQWM